MTSEEKYGGFMDWLKANAGSIMGLCAGNEDLAIRMVKAGYTPEEAELLTGMSLVEDKTIDQLATEKQIDPAELKPLLDQLGMKGSVWRVVGESETTYRLNDPIQYMLRSLMWPGQRHELALKVAPLANEFHRYSSSTPNMVPLMDRSTKETYDVPTHYMTIPIEGTVKDTRQMMPYEDVIDLLENHWSYYSVSACVCAVRNDLDPMVKDCDHPLERCLHMDNLGRYIVANGMGREVTLDEAKEIVRQAQEAGLFHSVNPITMDGLDTLCNCCTDCCYAMEYYYKYGSEWATLPSNFAAVDDPKKCMGCGECVEFCPMNAKRLRLKKDARGRVFEVEMGYKETQPGGRKVQFKNRSGQVATTDRNLCIGCGLCANRCSTQTIKLEARPAIRDIPKDYAELAEWQAAAAADHSGALSTESTVGTLMSSDEALAVMEKHIPGFGSAPGLDQAKSISLKMLAGYSEGWITDEALEAVDADLSKLEPRN